MTEQWGRREAFEAQRGDAHDRLSEILDQIENALFMADHGLEDAVGADRWDGDFTTAMAFQFASTNLVLELGLILWTLLGWQFTLAQLLGGFVMIGALALVFRPFPPPGTKMLRMMDAPAKPGSQTGAHAHG